MDMKRIEVVAAIIEKDGKLFATQRGYGEWKDWWEFPGGKIEAGESREEALRREIKEELRVDIYINRYVATVESDYPKFHLTLHFFLCGIADGSPTLVEAEASRWLTAADLPSLKWLPADREAIDRYLLDDKLKDA